MLSRDRNVFTTYIHTYTYILINTEISYFLFANSVMSQKLQYKTHQHIHYSWNKYIHLGLKKASLPLFCFCFRFYWLSHVGARGWGAAEKSYPTSKEQLLRGLRRAEKSYSTFKVRRGSREKIPLVQGKEQGLCFAGAAVKRYPTSEVEKLK